MSVCFVSCFETGSGCVTIARLDLAVGPGWLHPAVMHLPTPESLGIVSCAARSTQHLLTPTAMGLCIISLSSVICAVNISLELIIVGCFPWFLEESFIL